MRIPSLLIALLTTELSAQSLPVVPMHMDPDQVAHSLRERIPLMPAADCSALDLWECHPDEPARVTDISLQWVQLDDDPELEAVLITEAKAEDSYAAYVFDKQGTWNLVGSFFCRNHRCDRYSLIRVKKLTEDSPPLLLCYRDLGGSDSSIMTTEAFQLRGGKLWPAFQVTNYEDNTLAPPHAQRQEVSASANRIVLHTSREEPPGHVSKSTCEVKRWDAARHTFVPVVNVELAEYCDPNTGKPVPGKSFPAGLPAYP